MIVRIGLVVVALLAALSHSDCTAATILFSDRSSWQSATSGTQTETFNQYGNQTGRTNSPLVLDHFSLVPLSPNQRVRLRSSAGQYLQDGSNYAFTSGLLRIDFAEPFTAFALDHKATTGSGLNSMEIFDSSGSLISSYNFRPSQPVSFTGFLLDAGETAKWVEISPAFGPTDTWSQDNVSFASVPEPATWQMLLACSAMLAAMRRRRA